MTESNLKRRLKRIRKSKLAQIRGVDFALAMLIFIIAFSQVVLVLTNLLIPSLIQMETYSKEQDLNRLYHNVFLTEGTPSNWGQIGTATMTDFRLGLMNNQYSHFERAYYGFKSYFKNAQAQNGYASAA